MKVKFSVRSLLIFLAICFTTLPALLFGVYIWSAALVALFCGLLGAGIASVVAPNFKNLPESTANSRQAEFNAISRIADTILIARSDGQVTYLNDAGIRMFGDVLGKQLKDLIGAESAARVLSIEQPPE